MSDDTPICGYGLADGSMCVMPREEFGDRCADHRGTACAACGREATHDCEAATCGHLVPLCTACVHISGNHHGRPVSPRETAEDEMARAVELILEGLNDTEVLPSTQIQRRDAAGAIWRGLSTHVALKVLAGLAQPEKGS